MGSEGELEENRWVGGGYGTRKQADQREKIGKYRHIRELQMDAQMFKRAKHI